VLPTWLTLCGMAAVLVAVTHNVAGRARGQWLAEAALADLRRVGGGGSGDGGDGLARGGVPDSLRARLVVEDAGELAGILLPNGSSSSSSDGPKPAPALAGSDDPEAPKPPAVGANTEDDAPGQAPAHAPARAHKHRAVPPGKLAALVALFLIVVSSDFFKARVVCGSAAYWSAVLCVVPPALAVTAWARMSALRHAAVGPAVADGAGGAGDEGDHLAWTPARTLLFPAVSSLAGLFAGLFGVGGGILKAPVLLALGVDPAAAAATSMTMILFTSASASAVYLGFGTPRDWSAAAFALGAASSAVGVLGLARAVAASGGRRSLVTIAMAATLGVSSLASGWEAGSVTAAAARAGELGKHGSVCLRV
jgi:uncharacterized membrane protein YfcA